MQLVGGVADGPAMKQVDAELQKRRLVRAKTLLPYGVLALACVIALMLVRATNPEPRRNSLVQDVCTAVIAISTLLVWAVPRALTLRILNTWSTIVVVTMAVNVSAAGMGHYSASPLLLSFGSVIVISLLNMNLWLNLAWLCSISLAICSAIVFDSESSDASEHECRSQPRIDIVFEVFAATLVFGIFIALFHQLVRLAVRCEIEARSSRTELKAARSVLSGVCDAVVELDSDFRLQDGSPQLVDMLLLNPQRSLLGEDLRSFLASEKDRQKFSEQMGKASLLSEDELATGLSAAFHVSMRDSSSIPLDAEVFSVRFVNREGKAAYFVGIREFTDTSPMLRGDAPEVRHRGQTSGLPGAPRRGGSSLASAPRDDASHCSQDSWSVHSGASSWDGEALLDEEPAAWIDVLSPRCPVKHCTPAFAQWVDTRGGELLAAMQRSQRPEFTSWSQEAYRALLHAQEAPEDGSGPAHLEYRRRLFFKSPARRAAEPAGSARAKCVISTTLRLDLARPPDQQDHGPGVVRILLQDPKLGSAPKAPKAPPPPPSQPRRGTPTTAEAASGQLRDVGGPAPPARAPRRSAAAPPR
ncbi:unnamed protein product [Prorocentrum cordatum]|uniref:Uncharacterized protein n=1 Tax=Prorocentrum cordatum TaxID=2364126 RepID=A0ABN9QKM3_9DINO|nr:unnamed protein product [Polarella glacialis]